MREAVEAVADGDLDVKITKSSEEIEALSGALRIFRDNAKQKRELE